MRNEIVAQLRRERDLALSERDQARWERDELLIAKFLGEAEYQQIERIFQRIDVKTVRLRPLKAVLDSTAAVKDKIPSWEEVYRQGHERWLDSYEGMLMSGAL